MIIWLIFMFDTENRYGEATKEKSMYYFTDYNDATREDLCIKGEDYKQLVQVCFQHAVMFSFAISKGLQGKVKGAPKPIFCQPHRDTAYNGWRQYVYYYPCTEETKEFLLRTVDDFFAWLYRGDYCNPEDLTFYREDRSIFFWSETHEGVCALLNRAGEDVSSIIKQRGWCYTGNRDKRPDLFIPAESEFEDEYAPSF